MVPPPAFTSAVPLLRGSSFSAAAASTATPCTRRHPTLVRAPPPHTAARRRAGRARMQVDGAEEEAPSDTYVPAAEMLRDAVPGADAARRERLRASLLQLAAVSARGQLATDAQKAAVDDVVMALEEVNPNAQPVETELIDGMWTLVYSSARLFQSNPFLMAAVTPLLQLGQIRQRVMVDEGRLVTEVDVVAFPGTSGTIITSARVTPVGGERLEVVVEKTTLKGGKIAGRLDLGGLAFDVPVEKIFARLRNTTPETYIDTYYLDDKLRISRSKQGKLYIYTRLE